MAYSKTVITPQLANIGVTAALHKAIEIILKVY